MYGLCLGHSNIFLNRIMCGRLIISYFINDFIDWSRSLRSIDILDAFRLFDTRRGGLRFALLLWFANGIFRFFLCDRRLLLFNFWFKNLVRFVAIIDVDLMFFCCRFFCLLTWLDWHCWFLCFHRWRLCFFDWFLRGYWCSLLSWSLALLDRARWALWL